MKIHMHTKYIKVHVNAVFFIIKSLRFNKGNQSGRNIDFPALSNLHVN